MATDRIPPKPVRPQGEKAAREAKLAEALRANLRRRKAEPKGAPRAPPDGESS